jgi:undecaprenyl diphosphate synthase
MGINKFYDFLQWCHDLQVQEVTIYALSTENLLARDKKEIETLYKVFNKHALKGLTDKNLHDKKVRVNFCGDKDLLIKLAPDRELGKEMVDNLNRLEQATKAYKSSTLNLAIAYGGRQEIINAAKKVFASGQELTEESIGGHLWIKGEPDIVIRTSEERLSNFLLWQSAYSEIYFLPKLWQEFEKVDLEKVLLDYRNKERRYGK